MTIGRALRLAGLTLLPLALALTTGCSLHQRVPSESVGVSSAQAQVERALERYDSLVRAMNSAAIAAMFMADGEIVNPGQAPIRGRSAIEAFLGGFGGYEVLENATIPSSTKITGNSAVQVGSYHQRVRTPQGQFVEVSGSFEIVWTQMQPGEWLIQRAATRPKP